LLKRGDYLGLPTILIIAVALLLTGVLTFTGNDLQPVEQGVSAWLAANSGLLVTLLLMPLT